MDLAGALDALRLRRGSLALIGLRVLALIALTSPLLLASASAIDHGLGRMPHALEHDGPLPLSLAGVLLREAGSAALPLLLLSLPCFVLLDFVLTAAASDLLGDRTAQAAPDLARLWQRTWQLGRRHLFVYLKLASLALSLLAAAAGAAYALREWASVQAARANWSAVDELVVLPAALAVGLSLFAALVGAHGLSCRVLCVAGDRRRALRCMLEVGRLLLRSPALVALLVACALALQSLGGVVLALGYPPLASESKAATATAAVCWLAYLTAHSYLWHARIAWVLRAYADSKHDDIRARGDAPLPWRYARCQIGIAGRLEDPKQSAASVEFATGKDSPTRHRLP